jgi:hypothetical protein
MAAFTSEITVAEEEHIIAGPGEPIVNITPFTARQKASGYVGGEISHLLIGEEPALVFSRGRVVWRVPIQLTYPQRGKLGLVGQLDVDARTGRLLIHDLLKEEIISCAKKLVANPEL